MLTDQGIAIDTWVSIDGACKIDFEVGDDQMRLIFGHGTGLLTLCVNQDVLTKLGEIARQARQATTAPAPDGNDVPGSGPEQRS